MADEAVADQDPKPWDLYSSKKPWDLYGSPAPESIDQEDQLLSPPAAPPPVPETMTERLKRLNDQSAEAARNFSFTPALEKAQDLLERGGAKVLNEPAQFMRDVTGVIPQTTVGGYDEQGRPTLTQVDKPLPFQPGQSVYTPKGTIENPTGNDAQKLVAGFLTPGNIASFPFAASKAVQAAFLMQTAPAAVQAAEKIVAPGSQPGERRQAALDFAVNAIMTHGLAHGLVKGGEPNASSQQEAAAVHGDLRAQPVQGEGEVPAEEGGGGVQPQAEGAVQAEVPLKESAVDSMKPEDQGTLTHADGIRYGLTKGSDDVTALQQKYDAATKEQIAAFQSGDGPAAKAAFGKANYYGGALMGATRGEHPISGSNYENFLKAHPDESPTSETGAGKTKNAAGEDTAQPQSHTVITDESTGENHVVNEKGEIVESHDNPASANAAANVYNGFKNRQPQVLEVEKPFLDPEDQKHFDAERGKVGAPVELTDDANSKHPFAQNAMAWADRDTGKIMLNKDSLKHFLGQLPSKDRPAAIRSVLAEENIHLHTDDAAALTYWKNLSPWEQSILKRRYAKGFDLQMSDENWGHEALRYRIQQLARMKPTEVALAIGKEKWTLKALSVAEHVIRNARAIGSLMKGKESRAIIRRIQQNITATRQEIRRSNNPAAFRGRPKVVPTSKEQQDFVLPGMESTRLAGSKIAASNIPGQEGAELPQTSQEAKTAGDAALAAKVPQRPNAAQLGAIGQDVLKKDVTARLEEAKEGKNVRLPNLKDFTADLKKTWSALKPGEISDLWSGTVGKFIDTASGEDLRVLGKAAFGGNVREILSDKELNERFKDNPKAAVEYSKRQDRALAREGKKGSSIWNAPVPDAPKPGEGPIGDYQKAEIKQHELEQNLRNAIAGGDAESAARIRSGIADIKHHILHKLKEPYKAAVQRQKRRGWISSALFRKMVKPEVPDSEGILNRKSITADDVRPSNDGRHSSYTYLGGMPESKIAEALSDKARRSSSDAATVTRRVAVLEDRRTGTVHIVSAYDHPHGPDVEHDVRILDPLSPTRTHLPMEDVLKRYKALYSVFLDQPVRKFRQDFEDRTVYNEKFGDEVERMVSNAMNYSPDTLTPSEFSQEAGGRISEGSGGSFQGPHRDLVSEPTRGAAETAETTPLTDPEFRALSDLMEAGGSPRNAADVKRVLQEMVQNKPSAQAISALRKMAAKVAKDHPDWDANAQINALAHNIYEKSIQSGRALEAGGKPAPADTGEDAGTGSQSAGEATQDLPKGPLSRAAEPKDVTPPMAFNRRKLEEKRDETMTNFGVAKQRVANAFKRQKTSDFMSATIDGADTVANNMGQNAEWSVRMESSDGAKNRVGYAKDFRGKKDVLEAGPAFLSAGGVKTIYSYDARAMAEKARLLREDPLFLQWSMKIKAMLGGPNRKDIPYAQKELGAALEKRLIEKGFLHHKDAQYVYNNEARSILDKFMAQIRQGDEQAKRMSQRGNVWDRYRGRKWLKSNEKIMRSLEFAKAHWDNPEVRSTARRIKMELDRQFDLERDNGYNINYDEDYLPGRYEGDIWSPSGMLFGGQRVLGKQFRAGAVFDNIYEAASNGPYIPASLDGASLVGSRVRAGMHSVSRRMWWDSLKELKDNNGNFVAKAAKVTDGRAGSPSPEYVPFNMPGTTDRIYIHQGYQGLVGELVDPSATKKNPVGRALLETGQFLKHTVLLGDVFHLGRVAYYGVSIMGKNGRFKPGWAATAIREEDLDRAVKSGNISAGTRDYLKEKVPFRIGPKADMISRSRLSEMYERSGLNTGRIQDAIYKDLVRNVPGFSAYNRFLFDRFTTGMMKSAALKEFDRLSKLDPEKDSRQIVQESSKALNDYFGSIGRQGWIKSATFQDLARITLLAPQWLEGLVKKELQPVKLLTSPLQSLTGRDTAFRGIGRGMVSMLVLTQVINLINRGTPTWMNPEDDHKWDAYVGGGVWLSPLAVFNELTSDVLRLWQTKQRKWDIAQQIGSNKLGFWGRVAVALASGNAPSGEYQSTSAGVFAKAAEQLVPTPISFGTWAQFAGHMLAPGTVPPVPPGQLLQKAFSTMGVKTHVGLDPVQKSHLAAEMFKSAHGIQEPQIQFTDEPTNSKLRYQLRIGDEAAATKTLTALRKTHQDREIIDAMEEWSRRPFTSKKDEGLFVAGMDDEGRRVYQMAIQQRYDEVNKFLDWYTHQPVR